MIGLGWLPAGSHVESDWIQSGPIPVTYRFLRLQARLEQIKDNKSGEQLMNNGNDNEMAKAVSKFYSNGLLQGKRQIQ
ncbi:unnamed protein product [Adineta ricciae]|uniref:Uncharacterized protein n=1 Tax=Adineta ricciae TaxID=249248 RepID=A0A813MBD9_ADIRI|nr:unnamed protein product [Adineta ricciae]